MAKISTQVRVGAHIVDDMHLFREAIPGHVIDDMLTAQADVIEPMIRKNGETMLKGKYSKGDTIKSMKRKKPKLHKASGTKRLVITFDGTRRNGKKQKRNAEVAFVNEYGTHRENSARPFIKKAVDEGANKALEAAADVYGEFLDSQDF